MSYGGIALVGIGVEILDGASRELLVLREVEVGARVDTLHLLEAKRHVEFDVGGGVGVVGELLVVVVAVVFVAHAERLVLRPDDASSSS